MGLEPILVIGFEPISAIGFEPMLIIGLLPIAKAEKDAAPTNRARIAAVDFILLLLGFG